VNEKILNEDNQTHNFISSSGSGTVISYGSGSGSTSQKVTVPTVPVPVPVPQHWILVVPYYILILYIKACALIFCYVCQLPVLYCVRVSAESNPEVVQVFVKICKPKVSAYCV
jgi:hypothetical protein